MKRDEYLLIALIYALIIGLGFIWPFVRQRLPASGTGNGVQAATLLSVPLLQAKRSLPVPRGLKTPQWEPAAARRVQQNVPSKGEAPLRYAHGTGPSFPAKPVSQAGQPAIPKGTGNV